jgi:NAD(P)-dependent dehydrogenase (short-subunit alcohol dehydrogenase family)
MTRAVVPHMRRQGSGRIINIGSVLGFLPMPFGALYAATKHAVEGYSESLDHELRTRGIRVSVIEPACGLANRLRFLRRFAPAGLVDAGIRKDLRLDATTPARSRSAVFREKQAILDGK